MTTISIDAEVDAAPKSKTDGTRQRGAPMNRETRNWLDSQLLDRTMAAEIMHARERVNLLSSYREKFPLSSLPQGLIELSAFK